MNYFWIFFIFGFTVTEGKFCHNVLICDEDALCCGRSDSNPWCCPKGTLCYDELEGVCLKGGTMMNVKFFNKPLYHLKMLQKYFKNIEALEKKPRKNPVPVKFSTNVQLKKCDEAGLFYCSDTETCCQVHEGWACCRYTNGTCCTDGAHCCPSHTTCSATSPTGCSARKFYISTTTKTLSISKASTQMSNIKKVIFCPGRKQICPDTNTCCLIGDNAYGCCPYEDAVCCSDLTHCCPPNTSCDIKQMKCLAKDRSYKKNTFPMKSISF